MNTIYLYLCEGIEVHELEKFPCQTSPFIFFLKKKKVLKSMGWETYAIPSKEQTLVQCLWEWKLVQGLWKTVWKFLKRLEIEHTILSSNSISGNISKRNKNTMLD